MSDEFPQFIEEPAEFPQLIGETATVAAEVIEESGRWAVYLDIITANTTRRHRINDYPTRRKAEIAADLMRRCADRDIKLPPSGF